VGTAVHEEEAEEEGEKREPFIIPPQVVCWNIGYWWDELEGSWEEGGWEYWPPKTALSSRPGVDYITTTTTTTTTNNNNCVHNINMS